MDTEHAVMEQQKACIVRNLLNKLERQDNEDKEFVRLRNQSIKYRDDKTYTSNSAETQENIKKNRYKDILPFDHSRVKLTLTTSKDDTDYINASFIKGVTGTKAYIATQGPLHHTVLDFLRMLWEYDIKVIVMACREFEMGKKKCERYWPHKEEKSKACGPFIVDCDCEEDKGAYLTRTLRLTYDNQHRTLKQLHYVNWPDHGVPDSIPSILDLLEEMRTYQSHDDIPLCIHCSAGCGRTGVLCIIDYTWNLLKKETITPDFNICDLVHTMRTQRPSVVQTKEQYELVYSVIRLLFERYLQSMDEQSSKNQLTRGASMREQDLGNQKLQCQRICDEEMNNTPQKQKLGPSVPEGHLKDRNNPPDQPQLLHGALTSRQEEILQNGVHTGQEVAAVENIWQGDDIPSPKPPASPIAAAASICLLVEDPYFDSPPFDNAVTLRKPWTVGPIFSHPSSSLNDHTLQSESTVTSGAHTDVDVPPPLPERTPESYQLFVNTGSCTEPNVDDLDDSNSSERLTITIPPSGVAEAVQGEPRESPVTPAPSLPDRTPESYELASHQAPVASQPEVTPAANLNRIGTSSEWSGTSERVADSFERETKPWARSKSLRVKMTFSGFSHCISRTEPLTTAWLSHTPLEAGSAQVAECDVNQKASFADGVMSGDKSEKSNEKAPSCKKKLFRDKQKTKPATPGLLPSPPKGVVTSFFKFGFGNRLGKPKGPRNYPQSWF
ncbi:tyrosine-protein phosphatase non-receptor type 22-like isoform X4 [Hippocampus comes]|uniref:tyrosine-protein phosphatase non-receptor type 22-like isoform X4 n=1 Tax=Hippocampus comes TaxID=109280 RepID=UPI00094E9415|nr:PREDICTED: tyrosine-protein phosphatase non-receptor type 22-like isoform X4 [Hippocampus comes]